MPRPAIALLLALACPAVQAEDLLQAYELSLRNDPKVAADRAAYDAALQAKPLARALLLPQLSLSGEYARNREETIDRNVPPGSPIFQPGVDYYNSQFLGLRLSQALFDWSAFAQLRQADASLFAAEVQLAAATQAQIIRVATRYFDVLAAEDSLRTAQAEKTAIASQLERARRRFEVGMSPILDVQEAQARYDTTVAQEIEARRLLRSAREALRAVTGRYPETLAGLREPLPLEPPQPADADRWVQTALQNNLQIQGAQAQSDIARTEIQKQMAGHYPSLSLQGSYNYSDTLDAPTFGREQEVGKLALALAIPLYAGGGVQAGVRQAAHTHAQRQAELELARREVERQTRDAYEGVVVGISRVEALAQALKSNRTALETTEAGYRVGARTVTDTLDAQGALYRAERDYARARYDYLLNTLLLKQSTGQLTAADLKTVNALLAAAPAARPQPTGVTPPAPGYPPGVIVAPEKPIKLEQPLPETPAPAAPPPAPAPAP
jgi:outer membrane protein